MDPMLAFITSPQDWIVIFGIVLLLFGAKKLPELARGVGKSMGEFKKAREDFDREVTTAAAESHAKEPAAPKPAAKDAP